MKSDAKNVDECIRSLEGGRKEAIVRFRELINKVIFHAKESMKYKMPTYQNGD